MPKLTRTLFLRVKTVYFNQIKSGEKKEEYRLYKPYWITRLVDREYDYLTIDNAYKPKSDPSNQIHFCYNGYDIRDIIHMEFGKTPEKVFAIYLED